MKHLLPVFVLLVGLGACTKDNVEDLTPPGNTCDTDGVTYENTVKDIMTANCTVCHSPTGTANWLDLTTYQGVKNTVDNGLFNQRVLVLKDMPPSGPLSVCEQSKLTQWIADGAPEK
jgi:uncharacterized membrane protein